MLQGTNPPARRPMRHPVRQRVKYSLTLFGFIFSLPYSSKVQQPLRATTVMGRHSRTRYADHNHDRADSLHPEGQDPASGWRGGLDCQVRPDGQGAIELASSPGSGCILAAQRRSMPRLVRIVEQHLSRSAAK